MSAGNGTATFANATYTYDAMGRIATVGNSADTLTYSYKQRRYADLQLYAGNGYDCLKQLGNC